MRAEILGRVLLFLSLAEWQAEQCHGKGCIYPWLQQCPVHVEHRWALYYSCSLCRIRKSPVDLGMRLPKNTQRQGSANLQQQDRRKAPTEAHSFLAARFLTAFSKAATEVGDKSLPFLVRVQVLLVTTKTSMSEPAL